MIMCGEADVIVAGGAESAVSRLGIAGFNACRALSTAFNDDPEAASRPWDRQRDGFVMGEGAAVLVLEDYEHAKSRGAKIYAELLGYGYTGDAYHITSPAEDGDGGFRAMKIALQKSGVSPEQIGYINAHSTATQRGDMIEIAAIKRLFQDDVASVSISSTKSSIGHLLGAAGSVEAVFSILAMVHGIIPPTLNLHDPDDGCEGLDLVPLKAKERAVDFVLSNSFGFGGTNVSLVFKKHQV
jgi:3-oxoacyl-[acyl-carrier-protein] synthase II